MAVIRTTPDWSHQLFGGVLALYILSHLQLVGGWLLPPMVLQKYRTLLVDGGSLGGWFAGCLAMIGLMFAMLGAHVRRAPFAPLAFQREGPAGRCRDPHQGDWCKTFLMATGGMLVPLLAVHWLILALGPEQYRVEFWQDNQVPVIGLWYVMVSGILVLHCVAGVVRLGRLWWPRYLVAQGKSPLTIFNRYLVLAILVWALDWLGPCFDNGFLTGLS